MSNVRNWASGLATAALILLAPVITFAMVFTLEMLTDLVTKLGGTAVWPVVAGVPKHRARWQQERGGKSRMEWFAPPLRQADVPD